MHLNAAEPRARIRQGVRGTHSNGRVIRDGSILPSMLECISVLFSFSHFEDLRLVHTCNTLEKRGQGTGLGQ